MNALEAIMFLLASSCVVLGVFTLVSAWFAPKLLSTSFMKWMTTGSRLAPTRANRTLMAIWAMLIGSYLILVALRYTTLSFVVFAAWLPFGVVVVKRTFWPSTES